MEVRAGSLLPAMPVPGTTACIPRRLSWHGPASGDMQQLKALSPALGAGQSWKLLWALLVIHYKTGPFPCLSFPLSRVGVKLLPGIGSLDRGRG